MDSPVDFISGPREGSTEMSFEKENTGAFTPKKGISSAIPSLIPNSWNVYPKATFVAMEIMGTPVILLKKGTVRLARGFTSRRIILSLWITN